MSRLKVAALRAVKTTAAAYDVVRAPPRGAVILLYHQVGTGAAAEMALSSERFAEQMAILSSSGRATTLDGALEMLDRETVPARDPVVVTFDDGTADFVDNAVPILAEYDVPALLYLSTDFVETQQSFPWGSKPVSWSALCDTTATGLVDVGSHTHTHAVLDALGPDEITTELDRSRRLIEDRLGTPARHFAYPKGMANSPAADAAVRNRFASAALGRTGVNRYRRTDAHRLMRSPIQASDTERWFHRKLAGGLALEGTVRNLINRRRYADARH